MLSDFGADVIKIEPPGAGDPYRNLPNLPGYPHSEHNFAWLLESRNKRSIALDLTKPDGQGVLHKLAAEADVLITNMPLQVRQKLGITYDHLAPTNERLINEVAVGIARLSFMARASVAAGPRSGFASLSAAAGFTPSPSAESTSDLVIFPPAPVPLTPARSTPLA